MHYVLLVVAVNGTFNNILELDQTPLRERCSRAPPLVLQQASPNAVALFYRLFGLRRCVRFFRFSFCVRFGLWVSINSLFHQFTVKIQAFQFFFFFFFFFNTPRREAPRDTDSFRAVRCHPLQHGTMDNMIDRVLVTQIS